MAKIKFFLDLPLSEDECMMVRKEVTSIDQSAQVKFISDENEPELYTCFVVKTKKEERLQSHRFETCDVTKVQD